MMQEATLCSATAECKWRESGYSYNSIPSSETPLFTKEFCHTIDVTSTTTTAMMEDCLKNDVKDMCITKAECMWSNGKALIPDHDFCAPTDITDDLNIIKTCGNNDAEAVCVAPCKWRRGKQAPIAIPDTKPTNTQLELTGDFFSKNLCRPAVNTKTSEDSTKICLATTDA